jgi:hypothetical protein
VASSLGAPKRGQSRSQYIPRRGSCRTCSRGASRRLKPKYVHVHSRKEMPNLFSSIFTGKPTFKIYIAQYVHAFIANDCRLFSCTSCIHIITGVYFCRLKINHESHEFILDPGTIANSMNAMRLQALHRAPPQQPTMSVVKLEGGPAVSMKPGQKSCVRSSCIITLSARGPSNGSG